MGSADGRGLVEGRGRAGAGRREGLRATAGTFRRPPSAPTLPLEPSGGARTLWPAEAALPDPALAPAPQAQLLLLSPAAGPKPGASLGRGAL